MKIIKRYLLAITNAASSIRDIPKSRKKFRTGNCKLFITSVAFGGPNLDELYVTSGRLAIEGLTASPEGGFIYRVTGLNAKGLPGVRIVL
ncbi:hypothetical protein NQ314_002593 [Rhamnusium bicolor]|uniref:Uncharacterized protein n=1 Tax=Rhamnusium bicolor TaxID=1586634 RepID=A0AAV8ZPW6_9CUCU|nr:hypothetical protein NQ314_002593 [Rhamnusium bicolor]